MAMAVATKEFTSHQIEHLLSPLLAANGYAIVQMRFIGGQNRPTLQIMVEHADGSRVTLDECAEISRNCSALMDVEDVMAGAYVLEVSSPGVDRPLVRPADFQKYTGQNAKIEIEKPIDGRKRFHGRILSADESAVRLDQDGVPMDLPMGDILSAKLSVSDAILSPKPKKMLNPK